MGHFRLGILFLLPQEADLVPKKDILERNTGKARPFLYFKQVMFTTVCLVKSTSGETLSMFANLSTKFTLL